jgi:asparagine synthase (glutamine-hydrolysing)
MYEVTLGRDGSVLDVAPLPAPVRPESRPDEILLPIDELPQCRVASTSAPSKGTSPDTWTGGFSFAIWDRRRASVTAYRDHYGARPLYYCLEPGRLLLAGDLPSILARLPACPPLEEVSVMEYLARGWLSEGRTFHRSVLRLPAASRLIVGPGVTGLERYWEPWPGPRLDSLADDDLDAEFRHHFENAVASTLADGEPSGVLLSGGADSSAVLGMATALGRAGDGSSEPRVALTMVLDAVHQCDESERARETARYHRVPWKPVPIEAHSPLSGFDDLLERFGEPPCTVTPTLDTLLLSAARREGVRVLLDGIDADALFTPSGQYLSEHIRRLRWRRFAAEILALRNKHRMKPLRLARMALAPLAPEILKKARRRAPRWLNQDMVRRTSLEDRLRRPRRLACFEQAEAERVLAPVVGLGLESLRCLERLHGVDGRHPFFDPGLVNFLSSIPFERRFMAAESKLLMRRALGDLLAPTIRHRIDKTNYTPYFDWSMLHHLRTDLARLAEGGSEVLQPYVGWDRARPFFRSYLSGQGDGRMPIWRMLVLERWLMLECRRTRGGLQREGLLGRQNSSRDA